MFVSSTTSDVKETSSGTSTGASGRCPQTQGCRGPERRIYTAGVGSYARLPHKCGVLGAVPGCARGGRTHLDIATGGFSLAPRAEGGERTPRREVRALNP